MKYSIEKIKQYEKDGWIYSQTHPSLPLKIYNYSQATQYEAHWDGITLNCRGLVLDQEGNVISKGFTKFFNYSEGRTDIPKYINTITIYDKMDGSYIGLFNYEGNWIINSKGSFTSDQVLWAEEILKAKDLSNLDEDITYCFELIHPENRIVVDYQDTKDLIYLTAFDNNTGLEISLLERPKNFTLVDLTFETSFRPDLLKSLNNYNEEGFVIRFDNGERCKIKFDEYIRLHGIVTNTTSYDIWRCLMNSGDFNEILDRVPDEFYQWVKNTKEELESLWNFWASSIQDEYELIQHIESNKEFAEVIKDNKFKSFLFSLRNGRDISEQIWKSIKPKFTKEFQI